MTDFACEVSLVVVDPEVPGDEVRRWWNCKETPLLDDLVAAAPRLRLGKTIDDHFDDVPGPARRVFSLLFLRGTTPEYVAPLAELAAGQQPDQRGQDRPVGPGWPWILDLALEHGNLVPQDEDLSVLGLIGPSHQGEPAEHAQHRQVSES